jgi:hypothetical protein
MESLLTLSIGDYHTVEVALRLTVALTGMTALLLLLCTSCTQQQFRLPLMLSGVALLVATWFESGTWLAWKEAFELAGTSYCVTGHLLAGEDRIIAWSIGVPAILFCCGLNQIPWGKGGSFLLERLASVVLGLALLAPFSSIIGLLLLGYALYLLCFGTSRTSVATKVVAASILLGTMITVLGSFHLLPLLTMGKSTDALLVHGEIIRSLCDILSLVIPSIILLTDVLRRGFFVAETTAQSAPMKEKKLKPRVAEIPDPQSGLFGN